MDKEEEKALEELTEEVVEEEMRIPLYLMKHEKKKKLKILKLKPMKL